MSRIKALALTAFSFALAYLTFGLLVSNGLKQLDCPDALNACQSTEMANAGLIVAAATLLWLGVAWLMLREWGKD